MAGEKHHIALPQVGKKHLGVRFVCRSVLHHREAAEGLPQLLCNCFVELHLLFQVQADDAVVVIDPVAMEVIHLSLQRVRHGTNALHHVLFVLWGDLTSCHQFG